jgi:hypothetical protein
MSLLCLLRIAATDRGDFKIHQASSQEGRRRLGHVPRGRTASTVAERLFQTGRRTYT